MLQREKLHCILDIKKKEQVVIVVNLILVTNRRNKSLAVENVKKRWVITKH